MLPGPGVRKEKGEKNQIILLPPLPPQNTCVQDWWTVLLNDRATMLILLLVDEFIYLKVAVFLIFVALSNLQSHTWFYLSKMCPFNTNLMQLIFPLGFILTCRQMVVLLIKQSWLYWELLHGAAKSSNTVSDHLGNRNIYTPITWPCGSTCIITLLQSL